jgi:uncharacterized protein YbjT (DUF2867 family)
MDKPETLPAAVEGVERVFLVSPMDDRIEARETAVTAAAKDAGVDLVVKLYGAVKHHGDSLDKLHRASIDAIKASGMRWALLSPNSVMETSILSWAEPVKQAGALFGSSGEGKVGLIAADDATASGAALIAGDPENEHNYEVTGPQTLSAAEMAAALSTALGKEIPYNDMPEDDLRNMLVQYAGMTPEQAELGVLAHYRAWKRGDADLVTDTVEQLTGRKPTTLDQWLPSHLDAFR